MNGEDRGSLCFRFCERTVISRHHEILLTRDQERLTIRGTWLTYGKIGKVSRTRPSEISQLNFPNNYLKNIMSCPFCMIASGSPPSLNPPNLISSGGSAYLLLSTPLVVAFLDIAPVSRGHLLLCPRAHCTKVSDLSPVASAAIGFWLPILSRAVMKAIWGGTEGSWNIIQANGNFI